MQETQEMWVLSLGGEDPLEEENGNPLQYSCLKNPMDRGAWQATQSQGSQRVKHDWATEHGAQALSSIHIAIEQENRYWLSVVGMLLY